MPINRYAKSIERLQLAYKQAYESYRLAASPKWRDYYSALMGRIASKVAQLSMFG